MPKQNSNTALLQPGTVHQIGQVPNILALAHFLGTTPLLHQKEIIVFVPNVVQRSHLVSLLNTFNTQQRHIVDWSGSQHMLTQIGHADIIVADRETLNTIRLPSPQRFKKQLIHLAVGDTVTPRELKEKLLTYGYEHDATANRSGIWASRGEILDMFVEAPVRILFDGETIESIHLFDIGTGERTERLEKITIPPLHLRGRNNLTDYISPQAVIVWYEHDETLFTTKHLAQAQIHIEALEIPDLHNAGYQQTKAYHMRYDELLADTAKMNQVTVFTHDTEKVTGLFENSAVAPQIVEEHLPYHGIVHADSGTMLLTDRSIGIDEQEQEQRSKKVTDAFIQSLAPGDPVVHLYHGVARYTGMKTIFVNTMNREYIVLEFAAEDKIYLPVELAERIDRYLGDPNPTLQRLSDASWHQTVQKVRKDTLELAHELLEIYTRREVSTAPAFIEQPEEQVLDSHCPYELTVDQKDAIENIFDDMGNTQPMDRLLCGDVGFGKTEVALRAAFRAVMNGYQVAVLAPTTVLAQQHYDTFEKRLSVMGVECGQLSRLVSSTEQKKVLAALKDGSVDIVIGTHRLLSQDMQFKKIGCIVIDEEQRFGVHAKEALKKMRSSAHILSMTATPIPRTLHLSLAGIRSISTIMTPPATRKAIETVIKPISQDLIAKAITSEMERDGQVYYIYNRVQSIERRRRELELLVPVARIGVVHGQMDNTALALVMHQFDMGEIDLLLATTIVENGLDIPNANTLIVENASMFGLAELYQLKGRVGRSDRHGHAYFLYKERVPEADVKKRFLALQEASALGSGFELAMRDMEIRGVGNMLGKEQHGHASRIGLNLYIRLLNQAVAELQGTVQEPERDIPIDLPLESRIPEELLPDESDRILLYQKLANIRDRNELHAKRKQYTKDERFARSANDGLHPAIQGLFDFLEIKLLVAHSTLLSIDTMYPSKMNTLASAKITLSSDTVFCELPPEWEQGFNIKDEYHKAFATLDELGPQWVEKLKMLIHLMNKKNDAQEADHSERS